MVNSNTVTQNQQQKSRICKYFSEGTCTHDANHGKYRHVCNFCAKQGRNLSHSEHKHNFKAKSRDNKGKQEPGLPLGNRDLLNISVNNIKEQLNIVVQDQPNGDTNIMLHNANCQYQFNDLCG